MNAAVHVPPFTWRDNQGDLHIHLSTAMEGTLVSLPLYLLYTVALAEMPQEISFSALDCFHPKSITYGKLKDVCQPLGPGTTGQAKQVVNILQKDDNRVITGVKCTLRKSTMDFFCGRWSHQKLLRPMTLDEDQHVPLETCRTAYLHGVYQKEDKASIPVVLNKPVQYRYLSHGHITHTASNVYCEGSTLTVNGQEIINDMLTYVTATFTVQTVQVEYDGDNTAKDLDSNQRLMYRCVVDLECVVNQITYILDKPKSWCNLYQIRNIPMTNISISTEHGFRSALVSHDHKILLEKRDRYTPDHRCNGEVELFNTEFDDIKISVNSQTDLPSSPIGASGVDLDLELRVLSNYESYRTEQLVNSQSTNMLQRLCQVAQQHVKTAELSPFKPNSLIRITGELVSEIECHPIVATARLGETRTSDCTDDALPVYAKGQPFYLTANTHVLKRAGDVTLIPCNQSFNSIFISRENVTVMANPRVEISNVTLLDRFRLLPAGNPEIHEDFSHDILYTKAEVKQYNFLVHYARTKDKLLSQMTRKYCGDNACGSFAAKKPLGFDVSRLQDTLLGFNIWDQIRQYIQNLGIIGGMMYILYIILWIAKTVYLMLWLYHRKQAKLSEAFSLTFQLDDHVRQRIVSHSPRWTSDTCKDDETDL